MIFISIVFIRFIKIQPDGLPNPVFEDMAQLPWTFFSECTNRDGAEFDNHAALISKIYIFRLVIPLNLVPAPKADFYRPSSVIGMNIIGGHY